MTFLKILRNEYRTKIICFTMFRIDYINSKETNYITRLSHLLRRSGFETRFVKSHRDNRTFIIVAEKVRPGQELPRGLDPRRRGVQFSYPKYSKDRL